MRSWLCLVALVVTSVSEGNLYQARTEYKRAIFALETGRTRDFRRALQTTRCIDNWATPNASRVLAEEHSISVRRTVSQFPGPRLQAPRWIAKR